MISTGNTITASDFINQSEKNATPANDAGRVPKLEADGKIHTDFLPSTPVLTLVPFGIGSAGFSTMSVNSNTTAYVGLVNVPNHITVNQVSFATTSVSTAGTVDVSLYSEDGQTQIFSFTTASLTANAVITTTLGAAVTLTPGNYYIMVNSNGTTNAAVHAYVTSSAPFQATLLGGLVSGKPKISGTLTITAGTPPATFTPSSITAVNTDGFIVRFDN